MDLPSAGNCKILALPGVSGSWLPWFFARETNTLPGSRMIAEVM
jgi:hypothetical protein